MKKFIYSLFIAFALWSCGGSSNGDANQSAGSEKPAAEVKADDGKGVGEITNVKLNDPLNQDMVKRGLAIYDMKCSACHKLTAQRVVGPGFAGVTDRRKPEWIMNMITNVEVMLEEDPAAQALFEECLTRMPNQNVSIGDARDILEFFYDNDQGK
ncbi:MAG: cytochrome c [Saprospiraceae bacterium]|nr:cytochrome c [Saprospiraceae bacterium]